MISDIAIHIILGVVTIASIGLARFANHRSRISYELSQHTCAQLVRLLEMTAEHFKEHEAELAKLKGK